MGLRDRIRTFATPPVTADQAKPIGRSGTLNTQGFIQDTERNRFLQWPRNLDVYEEMRSTEATIRWMLALVATPIRAASWGVEPAGSEPEDKEVAAAIEHCLFNQLDGGWDEFLRQALTYLDFGHSVFERVAELRQVEFSYELEPTDQISLDNLSQTVTREMFVISRLAPRLQRTIQRWIPDPMDSSKLAGIEQWLADGVGASKVFVPADRLVVFVNEKEGDEWRGRSLLRSAYKPYENKRKLENLEAIAYERSAGLPVVYPPGDASDPQLDAVEEGLKKLRQSEQVYFIAPGPKQGTTADGEGWLFEAVSIQGDGSRSATEAITRYGNEMAMNVLAEFMKLGHEKTGARATADVQQDPYYQAVESYARYIEDVVSEQVIKPLCDWNYSTNRYPRLKASKITAKNIQWLGQVISQLTSAGAITVDIETENAVRDILDLPPRRPDPEASSNGQGPADQVPPPQGMKPAEVGQPANPNRLTFAEFTPSRPLTDPEQSVAFAEIAQRLDNAQADFAELAQRAAGPAIQRAEQQAEQAVASTSPAMVGAIWVQPDEIQKAIQGELESLYDEGRRQVRAEIRRQSNGVTLAEPRDAQTQQAIFMALATTAAASIAQAAQRALQAKALREIETGTEPTGPGYDPEAATREAARKASLGSVTSAFNAGRNIEIVQQADVVDHCQYSAMLDQQTCDVCDGYDGSTSSANDPEPPVPNPDCFGGGACRCIQVPVVVA